MARCIEDNFLQLSREILEREKLVRLCAQGNSMEPFLCDKETVIIKHTKLSELRPGDIVFYRASSQGVIHRIIKITSKGGRAIFITKGDANFYFDPDVYPQDIIGKIVAIEKDRQHIQLDTFVSRLKATYYVKSFLIIRRLYLALRMILRQKALSTALRRIQGFKIYGYLAKKFICRNIIYRVAAQNDTYLLARFYKKIYLPHKLKSLKIVFDNYLKDFGNSGFFLLAAKNNKIIGTITVEHKLENGTIHHPRSYFYNLFVDWRYRRGGVATHLIKLAVKKVKDEGAAEIKAVVPQDDKLLIGIFQKYAGISVVYSDEISDEKERSRLNSGSNNIL